MAISNTQLLAQKSGGQTNLKSAQEALKSGRIKYNAVNQSIANDPSNAQWARDMGITPNAGVLGAGGDRGYGSESFPDMPTMRSGRSMADLLGVMYDHDLIKGLMTDAVNKKYANLDSEVRRSQDMYYDTIGAGADALLGSLRRGDRDAVRSGASSGTQAAAELSALLGVTNDSMQGATELTQAREDLVRNRETELSNVARDAMKHYNELGINLGQLSNSELNALVPAYASQVATLGGIYNTDVLASVENARISSQENIAKWLNETNLGIADINKDTQISVAGLNRIAQEYSANSNSNTQLSVAEINRLAQQYAADRNKEAQTYTADRNKEASITSSKNYNSGANNNNSQAGQLTTADKISTLFGIIEKNTPNASTGFAGNPTMVENAWREIENLLGISSGSATVGNVVDAISGAAPGGKSNSQSAGTSPVIADLIDKSKETKNKNILNTSIRDIIDRNKAAGKSIGKTPLWEYFFGK